MASDHVCGANCMCKTCQCGMHKCPAKHVSSNVHYPADLRSEYANTFKAWPRAARAPLRPPAPPISDHPFQSATTHRTDFAPKKLIARTPPSKAPSPNACIGDGALHPLDDRTTYNTDFWDKSREIPRPLPRTAPRTDGGGGKFYGETTHHADFGPKPMAARARPGAQLATAGAGAAAAVGGGGAPFKGETTYHSDYQKCKTAGLGKREGGAALRCSQKPSDAKFSGESMYHSDYKAHKLPPRCPALLRPRPTKVDGDHFVYDDSPN